MCVPHCRADLRTNLHRMGYDVGMLGVCVCENLPKWVGIRLVMWVCAGDAPVRTLYEQAGYPRQ